MLDLFRQYYGPTMNAYAAAERSGRASELHTDLLALFEQQNSGTADETLIHVNFLKVIARK
jgi:hypothetical protein